MKKNVFENLIKLFNGTNTEKIANINTPDTNINEDSFSDDSYIEDVLNSEESIRLGVGCFSEDCKINFGL